MHGQVTIGMIIISEKEGHLLLLVQFAIVWICVGEPGKVSLVN